MPPRRRALLSAAFALALLARPAAAAQPQPRPGAPFATSIAGEGGPPVGATPIGAFATSTLNLVSLADVDPDAVCNDGSAAGYYYAPGSGAGGAWLCVLCARVGFLRACVVCVFRGLRA
jgi:hypothetical protein